MNAIQFDNGIKTYKVNDNATLSVNFADPSLIERILALEPFVLELEKEFEKNIKGLDELPDEQGFVKTKKTLRYMTEVDQAIKLKLADTFGAQNDFNAIFNGVNVLAYATNGKRVIANFLDAITPIFEQSLHAEQTKINEVVGDRKKRAVKNEVGASDNG